jgi:hypothetical protein
VASNPQADLVLTPLGGEARTIAEWLSRFHLASVVLDPYTNESAWVLHTATRILANFKGAAVRVNFIITCDEADANAFLGPLVDEFLVFCDPDRAAVRALGLGTLPAFVFIQSDLSVPAAAEGWSAESWRTVANHLAEVTAWSRPTIPAAGDPTAFNGTPAVA